MDNVVVIGFGNLGNLYYNFLKSLKSPRIKSISIVDPKVFRAAAKDVNCYKSVWDLPATITDSKCVWIVASPTTTHFDILHQLEMIRAKGKVIVRSQSQLYNEFDKDSKVSSLATSHIPLSLQVQNNVWLRVSRGEVHD